MGAPRWNWPLAAGVLPTGSHTVSLSVLDSDRLYGTSSVTVFVDQFRVYLSMIAK